MTRGAVEPLPEYYVTSHQNKEQYEEMFMLEAAGLLKWHGIVQESKATTMHGVEVYEFKLFVTSEQLRAMRAWGGATFDTIIHDKGRAYLDFKAHLAEVDELFARGMDHLVVARIEGDREDALREASLVGPAQPLS